jgi:hypothetical protein
MSDEKFERELRAANPVAKQTLEALDLAGGEASLGEAIVAEPALAGESVSLAAPRRRRRRSFRPLIAGATAIAAAAIVFLATGGASSSPEPAYGAQLVRFAESTPLLLLEGPDWRVENVSQTGQGIYLARTSRGAGSMEFVTGKPVPDELIRATCVRHVMSKSGKFPVCKEERATGMLPPSVRHRKVELRWFHGSLSDALDYAHEISHPHGQSWTKLPVLETTADVDTRAEFFVNLGGPGDRRMTALWSEGGNVLELTAFVPDLAAFEERLDWLTRVDSQTWLDAMPPNVVKAADHDAAVREMLRGIPVPDGFKPSQIPDEGLTTNRDQVAGSVTGIVSCLWFRQWGEARRTGDGAAEAEAEKAMATSKHWPILREMAKDGGYSPLVWQLAAAMPSGMWTRGPHRWRLLPHAEGLGCARWGMPVLPWKQRLQRERRDHEVAAASGRVSRSNKITNDS